MRDDFTVEDALRELQETQGKKSQEAARQQQIEQQRKIAANPGKFIRSEARRLAQAGGMIDVSDVESALDLDDFRVAGGEVASLEDAIASLKKTKPHYFERSKEQQEVEDWNKLSDRAFREEAARRFQLYGF